MSVLSRVNKESKERQGPTLRVTFTDVQLIEVSVYRESPVSEENRSLTFVQVPGGGG